MSDGNVSRAPASRDLASIPDADALRARLEHEYPMGRFPSTDEVARSRCSSPLRTRPTSSAPTSTWTDGGLLAGVYDV
jgi:hypothetical protein